jgi:hypothetical protein
LTAGAAASSAKAGPGTLAVTEDRVFGPGGEALARRFSPGLTRLAEAELCLRTRDSGKYRIKYLLNLSLAGAASCRCGLPAIMDLTAQRDSINHPDRQAGANFAVTPEALAALPSLEDLGVPPEMMEGGRLIADGSDVPGLEEHRLEVLVRYLIYHARLLPNRH